MTNKQRFIFNYLLMNTIMCIFMALAGLLVNVGYLTLPMYWMTLLQSLVICNLCTFLFRIPAMGERISLFLCGGDPSRKAFPIWMNVVNPTLNSFFMNTFMTLLNVGFRPEYFPAWLHSFPIMELVAVAVSFVAAPIAQKIVRSVRG